MDERNQILEYEQQLAEIQTDQTDVENKYLTFYLYGQLYGISIAGVIEIQQVLETTSMPELPHYVKGIISLRGEVIPIIDLNLRFGKKEREPTDKTCIIIMNIQDAEVGFVVDEVAEVITIEEEYISPPPAFGSEQRGRYVTGIAKLDVGLMLVLDGDRVLSDSELGTFSM